MAIVTGAARGIGAAVARTFANAGATVVVSDVLSAEGESVASSITAAGGQAKFVQCDVSRPEQVQNLVEKSVALSGRLDILVNNAGVITYGDVEQMPLDDFNRDIGVSLIGTFLCCKFGLRHLQESGRAAIVNFSSVAFDRAFPKFPAYSAAKGAVASLTKQLALEYGPRGVRVNAVAPGMIDTQIPAKGAPPQSAEKARQGALDVAELQPMGRMGTPEEVANAVLFLASDAASFVTGVVLPLDGGLFVTFKRR